MVARPDRSSATAALKAIFEATDDAIFIVAADGQVGSSSRSAERVFGLASSEIVGSPAAMLFAAHLRAEVGAVLDAVRAGDTVVHFETEIEHRDGVSIPVSLSAAPAAGGAIALVVRDITERQINQSTLAELEKRVRDSEALAHVGGWLWDVASGAVQWTEELHRIQGVDPLEFGGTIDAHLALVHEGDRQRVKAAMDASATSGHHMDEQYRVIGSDGVERVVHTRATPTVDSSGAIVALRGIAYDATD